MASGRTVSANILTELDGQILNLCESLSAHIASCIREDVREEFTKDYAKISRTRDAGVGRGGGKLQRDALCTRGRQGKAPFSNRNFRWHPLVVADRQPEFARPVEEIVVSDGQTLIFVAGTDRNEYPSELAHTMPEKFVALPGHWLPYVETLKDWNDTQWSQNSCVISAMEAANWWDAVESYAVLGMSVAINEYGADLKSLYQGVVRVLSESTIEGRSLPSDKFPSEDNSADIVECPVCKKPFTNDLDEFRRSDRPSTWQPPWGKSKKEEGDDSSIQVMHVDPLIESELRHNAENVRYGHRWCNVAMSDHSLDETLDFMQYILRAHNREVQV